MEDCLPLRAQESQPLGHSIVYLLHLHPLPWTRVDKQAGRPHQGGTQGYSFPTGTGKIVWEVTLPPAGELEAQDPYGQHSQLISCGPLKRFGRG